MKTVLMVAPLFDDVTKISSKWYSSALKQLPKDKFKIISLTGDAATRNNFEREIKNADIFAFWDHGNKDMLASQQKKEPPLVDLKNDHLLDGVETWTMACLSGWILGPDIVKKGGTLFQGYKFPFILSPLPIIQGVYGKCANKGLLSRLVDDKPIDECKKDQQIFFVKNILKLLLIPYQGIIFAVFLAFDLFGLVYLQQD